MVKNVFQQAMSKGPAYSFWFYLFFMMSAFPIVLLFFLSLFQGNLPGLALAIVFGGIIFRQIRLKRLFHLCRDMAILNMTLWFLLGFFSLIQGFTQVDGFLTYILLAPYAILSGYLVFYLLSRADKDEWQVLLGGVAVSTMIAVISAINGAIIGAITIVSSRVSEVQPSVGSVISLFNMETHNPHLAFLLVFVVFNVPFVRYYMKKSKKYYGLVLYVIPLLVYSILQGLWSFFAALIV